MKKNCSLEKKKKEIIDHLSSYEKGSFSYKKQSRKYIFAI